MISEQKVESIIDVRRLCSQRMRLIKCVPLQHVHQAPKMNRH